MAQLNHTRKMSRATFGNFRSKGDTRNILSISYGYTNFHKAPAAAGGATIVAASATSSGGTTLLTPITQPDVPRALTVTTAGTAADIKAVNVTITGTNVEGKVITEDFLTTVDTATTVTGVKAFKTVTSVSVPAQDGNGATYAVGTSAKLGLNHRLSALATTATVRVVTQTTAGARVLQTAPSAVAQDATLVESNTVTPATAPNGSNVFSIHYFFYNWHLDPTNGQPVYGA